MPPKQRSIFEFTAKSVKQETIIDLTSDPIPCPICNIDLLSWSLASRMHHVDSCLNPLPPQPIIKRQKTETSVAKEPKVESKIESKSQTTPRKGTIKSTPNSLPLRKDDKVRYINIEVKKRESAKIIKPPPTISGSKTKRPIPTVKVLQFPLKQSHMYEIAVDAFCYASHPTIDQYFLTHFHSDHYGGISKKWSYERVFEKDEDMAQDDKYKSIIYCSPITGKLLTLRFSVDPRFICSLELDTRYCIKKFQTADNISECSVPISGGACLSFSKDPGLYVTPITANHCPGSAIFLFESVGTDGTTRSTLHCGDFRVNHAILTHPSLARYSLDSGSSVSVLDKVYLDTTYMSPSYNFPKQELVCSTLADLFHELTRDSAEENSLFSRWFGIFKQSRITDFLTVTKKKKKKFLILVGTYLIGKERLAVQISKRLKCPIYVSNINSRTDKVEILRTYGDSYLDSVIVDDPLGDETSSCVVHLVPMKIVGAINELSNYFNHNKYYEEFERCVGLRPTGWSFVPGPASSADQDLDIKSIALPQLYQVLKKTPEFSFLSHVLPQAPLPKVTTNKKGKPDECLYRIYSVPYSEHSSYRELAYFVIFFNIGRVIPTVNIHNEWSIKKMDEIIRSWELARDVRLGNQPSDLFKEFSQLTLEDF